MLAVLKAIWDWIMTDPLLEQSNAEYINAEYIVQMPEACPRGCHPVGLVRGGRLVGVAHTYAAWHQYAGGTSPRQQATEIVADWRRNGIVMSDEQAAIIIEMMATTTERYNAEIGG